ncbi:phage head-tail adapter protein [Brevundimonas sp. FT23042]|uniref:phage head-tail adapter protein n=1 Tax=Brevundimonas sp. FT23042 TaxID=3393749 RepID=UPI003B58B014
MTGFRRPILASLLDAVEADTPYGGRSVTYEVIGAVWLTPGPVRRRERAESGMARLTETMTGEARSDPRLREGRLLRFCGGDWRLCATETVGGRSILSLERTR